MFEARGIRCSTTAEPTDGPIGQLIRAILSGQPQVDATTIAYLFASDRNEHIYGKSGILESIDSDLVMISDRYVLSSLAYQGTTCGPSLPWHLNRFFLLQG